jgi:hypothetical protein
MTKPLKIQVVMECFPRKPVYMCYARHAELQQEVCFKHSDVEMLKKMVLEETKQEFDYEVEEYKR